MSIVVIGINHRTAPVTLLEKMTVADSALPKALHNLGVRDDIREVPSLRMQIGSAILEAA